MARAALLVLLGLTAAAVAFPRVAHAGVRCSYDESASRLEVTVRGENAVGGDTSVGHIVRDGPLIRVIRQNELNGARKRIGCGGPVRFRGTSSVAVTMHNGALGLSLRRGPLPRTSVESRTLWNAVFAGATERGDRISYWHSGATFRTEVNASDDGASDLALAVRGRPLYFFQANGRGGDDRIAARGPAFSARAPHLGFIGTGGSGDDTLSTGHVMSILVGDGGDDSLLGGTAADVLVGGRGRNRLVGHGGDDRIDTGHGRGVVSAGAGDDLVDAEESYGAGGVDRIDCGTGRDRVDADRNDRFRRCELGVPRR